MQKKEERCCWFPNVFIYFVKKVCTYLKQIHYTVNSYLKSRFSLSIKDWTDYDVSASSIKALTLILFFEKCAYKIKGGKWLLKIWPLAEVLAGGDIILVLEYFNNSMILCHGLRLLIFHYETRQCCHYGFCPVWHFTQRLFKSEGALGCIATSMSNMCCTELTRSHSLMHHFLTHHHS